MNLLLDTNVLLRMLEQPERLSVNVREILDDMDNRLVVTAASFVEIAIKVGIGRLSMPDDILPRLEALGCEILEVRVQHAMRMVSLPAIHKNPFDRLIVAQAMTENLTLVTTDRLLAAYGASTIQA